ncbi:MAG: hypothetical protein ACODAE_10660 [Gemmatimonadota bacterium]
MSGTQPTRRSRWIKILSLAVVLAAAIVVMRVLTAPDRNQIRLAELSEELRDARAVADSCTVALEREEAEFQEFDRRVETLREIVNRYESTDPDGVPADVYESYLDAFDRYNEAVPEWRARADTLRAHWSACDSTVRAFNALADSLRPRIEALRGEAGPSGP